MIRGNAVRRGPAATADRASDREIAGKSWLDLAAGVGAAIMTVTTWRIFMPRRRSRSWSLDTGIRKPDVPIVVRQLVLPRPAGDLFRLTVRPAVAVFVASVALVQEALIVALELVVEDDAAHPAALSAQTLLGALVRAIDLGVVRQFAGL